jgi:hypothetical protein
MRRSLRALGLALALAALAITACTPELCARTSDCATGQICTAAGLCAIPADAAVDGQSDAAGTTGLTDATPDPEIPGKAP